MLATKNDLIDALVQKLGKGIMNLIILFILGILQLFFSNELSYLPLVLVEALIYVFKTFPCVLSVLSLQGSVS